MISKILKKIFYFLGSIKLAVSSMLLLMIIIATGTILESRYNADFAKMFIYQTWWFNGLIIVIWHNILFATLTRLPWKKHHIGFLITHLGLLMIFGGGFLTNVYGVDGSLRITEGDSSRYVVLQDLVLSVRASNEQMGMDYPMTRWTSARGQSAFSAVNEKLKGLLTVTGYEPFVEAKEVLKVDQNAPIQEPFAVSFQIKSAFFNVQQSLESQGQRTLQMGPATFKLMKEGSGSQKPSAGKKRAPKTSAFEKQARTVAAATKAKSKSGLLVVKVGSQAKEIPVVMGSSAQVDGYTIQIKGIMMHATVVSNGLQDNPSAPVNPALEVEISKGSEKVRDILYAKFPGFTLRKGQFPDLKLELNMEIPGAAPVDDAVAAQLPAGHSAMAVEASADTTTAPAGPVMGATPGSASAPNANQVLFYYSETHPTEVKVELWKAGKVVETKNLKQGEKFQTPWMGMELTISQVAWNAQKDLQVMPTTPVEKMQMLPPAAIRINRWEGAPAEESWLVEGEEKTIAFDGKQYSIYYGRKVIELPFMVALKGFKKTDYPGTSMAKEYESHVQVVRGMAALSPEIRISMNEPLLEAGYTLYQASFEDLGTGKYASILSVNLDPGRWFKYFGGIILAIGIITYTLSKSRRFKSYFN